MVKSTEWRTKAEYALVKAGQCATVPRLRILDWIARIQRDGMENTYARVLPGHHHRGVCTRCGVILVVSGCILETLVGPTLAATDFEIHEHLLEVNEDKGNCPARGLIRWQ